MTRKTIPVATAVDRANYFLEHSGDDQAEQRKGVASFLEALLTDADAYAGFSYTHKAGFSYTGHFQAADETRRQYNVHRKAQ